MQHHLVRTTPFSLARLLLKKFNSKMESIVKITEMSITTGNQTKTLSPREVKQLCAIYVTVTTEGEDKDEVKVKADKEVKAVKAVKAAKIKSKDEVKVKVIEAANTVKAEKVDKIRPKVSV